MRRLSNLPILTCFIQKNETRFYQHHSVWIKNTAFCCRQRSRKLLIPLYYLVTACSSDISIGGPQTIETGILPHQLQYKFTYRSLHTSSFGLLPTCTFTEQIPDREFPHWIRCAKILIVSHLQFGTHPGS